MAAWRRLYLRACSGEIEGLASRSLALLSHTGRRQLAKIAPQAERNRAAYRIRKFSTGGVRPINTAARIDEPRMLPRYRMVEKRPAACPAWLEGAVSIAVACTGAIDSPRPAPTRISGNR